MRFALCFLTLFSFQALAYFSDNLPYPFYEKQVNEENYLSPLHRGEEALQVRLELIRKAQRSIDVEYYIYATDMAGKIFTRELVKAAKRGVKVRILVDKLITELSPYYAKELDKYGIEVKYYNTSLILKLSTIHYRNHRKLFVIDGEEAIIGGRNMADEYFNLDKRYNFEDRDVWIKGPIVKAIQDSFNEFYNHEISHFQSFPNLSIAANRIRYEDNKRKKNYLRKTKEATRFLEETVEELKYRKEIEKFARLQQENRSFYHCPETTFASDAPGANFEVSMDSDYRKNFRFLRKVFFEKMLKVDKSIFISTPYFIANRSKATIYEDLLNREVDLTVYTNSLRSTDTIVMSSNLYLHLNSWLKKGMKMILHDGKWHEHEPHTIEKAKRKRWGTHSKLHIYEWKDGSSEVMIGTYNIDNRSDYYNAELAIFCKGSDEFTREIKDDSFKLADQGINIKNDSVGIDRNGNKVHVTASGTFRQIKMKLLTFPSWLIDFLL